MTVQSLSQKQQRHARRRDDRQRQVSCRFGVKWCIHGELRGAGAPAAASRARANKRSEVRQAAEGVRNVASPVVEETTTLPETTGTSRAVWRCEGSISLPEKSARSAERRASSMWIFRMPASLAAFDIATAARFLPE